MFNKFKELFRGERADLCAKGTGCLRRGIVGERQNKGASKGREDEGGNRSWKFTLDTGDRRRVITEGVTAVRKGGHRSFEGYSFGQWSHLPFSSETNSEAKHSWLHSLQ